MAEQWCDNCNERYDEEEDGVEHECDIDPEDEEGMEDIEEEFL